MFFDDVVEKIVVDCGVILLTGLVSVEACLGKVCLTLNRISGPYRAATRVENLSLYWSCKKGFHIQIRSR